MPGAHRQLSPQRAGPQPVSQGGSPQDRPESGLPSPVLGERLLLLALMASFPAVTNMTKPEKAYSERSTGAKHHAFYIMKGEQMIRKSLKLSEK